MVGEIDRFGREWPNCMDRPCGASWMWTNGGGGLAHLYPALGWSVRAPGHHGYPRARDLILGKAL